MCASPIRAAASVAGRHGTCKKCGSRVRVPGSPPRDSKANAIKPPPLAHNGLGPVTPPPAENASHPVTPPPLAHHPSGYSEAAKLCWTSWAAQASAPQKTTRHSNETKPHDEPVHITQAIAPTSVVGGILILLGGLVLLTLFIVSVQSYNDPFLSGMRSLSGKSYWEGLKVGNILIFVGLGVGLIISGIGVLTSQTRR